MGKKNLVSKPKGHQSFHFVGTFYLSEWCVEKRRAEDTGWDSDLGGHWPFQIRPKANGKFEVILSTELASALKIPDFTNVNGAEFLFNPATDPDTIHANKPCERLDGCASLVGIVYLTHEKKGDRLAPHEVTITLYENPKPGAGGRAYLPAISIEPISVSSQHFGIVH